jgi:hypothetical protein
MSDCRRDRLPAPAGGTPTCRCRLLEGEIDLLDRSPLLLVVVDLRTAAIFEGSSSARVPAHHGAAEPVVKLTVHLSPSTMSATGPTVPNIGDVTTGPFPLRCQRRLPRLPGDGDGLEPRAGWCHV